MEVKGMKKAKERAGQGFTLAELLIVVAIVAVLVAVAIPVFTSQLEKSRESTDFSDVRSAYAKVMSDAVLDSREASSLWNATQECYESVVSLRQRIDGWTTKIDDVEIGGVPSALWIGSPVAGGSCTVRYTPATDTVTIDWGGPAAPGGSSGGDNNDDNNGNAATPPTQSPQTTGNSLKDPMRTLLDGKSANVQFTITVHENGSFDVSFTHADGMSDQDVRKAIDDAGLLTDGKLPISDKGTAYSITVKNNEGHNGPNIDVHG